MTKKSYPHLLHRLLTTNLHGGIKLGLENPLRLHNALGFPAHSFPSIHIAGTNGKGSVTTKIAFALRAAGFRVGMYTSPHISCFRERIKINNEMISEENVERYLYAIFAIIDDLSLPATFFEITTLLAFKYFAEENIDFAVIETGLGGRLDATNIILPKLTIITSISLEHTEILGTSIDEITKEKAGIIKPLIPIVIGPKVPKSIIFDISKKMQSPCYVVDSMFVDFHAENEAIAKKSLEVLQISPDAISKGLKHLPPCRMETLYAHQLSALNLKEKTPKAIILDVAHNPDGFRHLLKAIEQRFPHHALNMVIGLSKNKDIPTCISIIKDSALHFHLVESTNDRGASKEVLKNYFVNFGVSEKKISCEKDVASAVINAAQATEGGSQKIVVICGTFFIMAAARKTLGFKEAQDPQDMNERG